MIISWLPSGSGGTLHPGEGSSPGFWFSGAGLLGDPEQLPLERIRPPFQTACVESLDPSVVALPSVHGDERVASAHWVGEGAGGITAGHAVSLP